MSNLGMPMNELPDNQREQILDNLKRGRERSLEVRRANPKGSRQKARKTAEELILQKTKYTRRKTPLAAEHNGQPSIQAEFGAFIATEEGTTLLRQALRAALIKASSGDLGAIKIVFGSQPLIAYREKEEPKAEDVAVELEMSPAERRRIEAAQAKAQDE